MSLPETQFHAVTMFSHAMMKSKPAIFFLHIFCINSSREHLHDECTILEFALWLPLDQVVAPLRLYWVAETELYVGMLFCDVGGGIVI